MQDDPIRRLQDRLRAVPSSLWPLIAAEAGVESQLPKKVVHRPRNFGIYTVLPLMQYFDAIDAGLRELPRVTVEA